MKIKIKTLILHLGYVETESISGFIVTHEHGFATEQAAVASLAAVFAADYIDDKSDCCVETLRRLHDANYCNSCGQDITMKSVGGGLSEFMLDHVSNILRGSIDDVGNEFYENMERAGWYQGYHLVNMKKALVVSNADAELSVAACGGQINLSYTNLVSNK